MNCLRPLLLLILIGGYCNAATTNWVSPTTLGTGDGASAANAWSLSTFLSSATSGTSTNDRNRYEFLAGTYSSISLGLSNIYINSYQKGRAEIVGSAASFGIRWLDGYQGNIIRGFRLRSSYLSGIKVNSHYNQILDCFIDKAGRGDPAWVTNNTGTYTGQGIEAHGWIGTVILRNRIRNGGARVNLDHGIYVAGTNMLIAANVLGSNLCWGAQIYDGSADNSNVRVFRNIMYGNGGLAPSPGGGSVLYTYNSAKQNYYAGNVISSYRDSIQFQGPGTVYVTNNILLCDTSYNIYSTNATGLVIANYNLQNKSEVMGAGSKYTNTFTVTNVFPGANQGRYWATASGLMTGNGLSTAIEDGLDWFGNTIASNPDMGAALYTAELEADDRDMNADDADYWIPPATAVDVAPGSASHVVTWATAGDTYHWEGIQVWRKAGSGGTYAKVGDVAKGASTYSDSTSGLVDGTAYYYKVALTNYVGRGPWSLADSITFTVPDLSPSYPQEVGGNRGDGGGVPSYFYDERKRKGLKFSTTGG